ncbi:hypothetical protein BofuT4_uP128090.1 [Botrytis cinerea T4]|uniref:Uncharacterized protein n=1 Tax=Botryotinia fuckeliana (strain T4) TaxID=999810 RepID=G2YR61_BOTF4|nr:hypothetical protein BofuT4_uP128090.1 [Botrytis cinerea T4]
MVLVWHCCQLLPRIIIIHGDSTSNAPLGLDRKDANLGSVWTEGTLAQIEPLAV